MFQIGKLRLHLINDAETKVDAGGPFGLVPRALWGRYLQPDAENLVPMQNHSLYLEAGGKKIVIDTGMGRKLDAKAIGIWRMQRPQGDVLDALARLGVKPDDIDLVIDTHLHADHCAGNNYIDDQGQLKPTFPNAEYVVQRREYEDAMQPNERTAATYILSNYQPLVESGQMRLLDGDTDLAPGVRGVVTRGHTPAHMSVIIEDSGEYAMFTCDLASYAVHFERLGWMTAYDVEPIQTLETKRYWQKWAIDTHALLIFPHDSVRPAGYLTLDDKGKPVLQPVQVEYS